MRKISGKPTIDVILTICHDSKSLCHVAHAYFGGIATNLGRVP